VSYTRADLPEDKYGKELAIGHSAVMRDGKREKVNLCQANGIAPAAGFSSNVTDLGKFAAWQFRLRDTTVSEVLKPSTLKYMQNVHWTNPDWKTTWGLGFVVFKGSNGNTWVGHGGSCPGYRSSLQLDLKRKMAFSVMINANGTNPGKYVKGIDAIISKVKPASDKETEKDLEEYTGYYNPMPWWSEEYISTWNGQLVSLSLPSDKPGDAMTFYKHIEGDTFRRVRDDDELGETIVFERDDDGQIIRYRQHGNYSRKIQK
jgi:CubicO group peptidase (beta-lactamase class C family)